MDKSNNRTNKKDKSNKPAKQNEKQVVVSQQQPTSGNIGTTTSESGTSSPRIVADLGLDISTSVTALCVLGEDHKMLELIPIKLATKFDNLWDKANEVKRVFQESVEPKYLIKRIFVEENAKRFSQGFTSADTILTLAKMNGIVSYIAKCMFTGSQVCDVNVRSARAKLGIKVSGKNQKDQVYAHVLKNHPDFPWATHIVKGQIVYNAYNKDMSDAYVICRAGQIIFSS